MSRAMLKVSLSCLGLVALVGVGHPHAARLPIASSPIVAPEPISPLDAHALVLPNFALNFQQQAASPASEQRALLNKYCITCHSGPRPRAGLSLDKMDVGDVSPNPEVWEKVVRKLRAGVMPPAGSPRPDKATYHDLIGFLETGLDRAAAGSPNPGRPVLHRLNRTEYTNAIRDLLALDIDGKSMLPGDDSGYGFDNIADVLKMSPGLLDRYLLVAQKIARIAIGDPTLRPTTAIYNLPYLILRQDSRVSEDLPFGSRGGIAIRHHFPLDGEYSIRIRLQRKEFNTGAEIRGLDVKNEIDLRIDGARVKLFTLDIREYGEQNISEDHGDDGLVVRVPVRAGTRVVGVTFPKSTWYVEGIVPSFLPAASNAFASGKKSDESYGKIEAGVDEVSIEGPYQGKVADDEASRRQIFVCRPSGPQDEERCAKQVLSTLARRAYRRPATERDVEVLLEFYQAGRRAGDFDNGIRRGLERLLTDPDFLFRVQRDPANVAPGTVYRISDLELASRLSFFLWSSIPDDQLLDLAASGKLKDPAVLDQQVRRMLADDKAKSLVNNFFGQWLYLRNTATAARDSKEFPDWDENLREAFKRETELFIESQLREDRPATELLTANYTFVNERLARHYGIPDIYGSHFRRIKYSDDRRGGVLGHGSVLTVTSYANRTSPVFRGKWMLENILGTPPPPPPPNVPPFPESDGKSQPTSVRARMEQHRRNAVCASCHNMLDPMGFALENFDAIGAWRTTEANAPIDPTGALPDGTKFDGPATFRKALLVNREAFMLTLAEKLLTYALGRGMEHYDMPAVRAIVREAASSDDRWSALISSLVKSMPFQMRRAES